MADTSVGMNPDPGMCYSLKSRTICGQCGTEVDIVNPEKITKEGGSIVVTGRCHGETETKYIEPERFAFTIVFFEKQDE